MAHSLKPPEERARTMHAFVLNRIQGAQKSIATAIGVSESTVSRLKNEHLEVICQIFAHAGIKAIPVEYRCMDPEQADAMFTMFQRSVSRAKSWEEILEWDDE